MARMVLVAGLLLTVVGLVLLVTPGPSVVFLFPGVVLAVIATIMVMAERGSH